MKLHEVILCAASTSTSNAGPGLIAVHDIQSGSTLASFKQTNTSSRCLAVTESRDGLGGVMFAAQHEKSLLNVYNFQKDQLALKIVLPEKLTCCASDHRGQFFAGGTAQGRIYIWEISSGILYNAWDAHYRQVNVLRFTPDGAALVSGSEDSGVSVWEVSRLLDDNLQNELPVSYCTFTDHTLPVTDLVCGVGPFPTSRILTSSVDHTVKLWDLGARTLLTTFHFPQPISHLAWEPTERVFFAASSGDDGTIYQMNLFKQTRAGKNAIVEAIGGGGATDIVRIGDDDGSAPKKMSIQVDQPITALCISLTSSLLVVGTSLGTIQTYDIPSHQPLRSINTHKGLAITHLSTMIRPPDLVGHVNIQLGLSSGVGVSGAAGQGEVISLRSVVPFDRTRDPRKREAREVGIILPVQGDVPYIDPAEYPEDELFRDHAYFTQQMVPAASGANGVGAVSLQSRVAELETEVQKLRDQLGKAKNVNDVMWETVVKKVIKEGKGGGDADASEEPKRKRGRT
ncbi:WD40 repeat-like protein [Gloeophyllum trabeum ATCC 11539]|uniref:Pre-rRNA-processing protein IPI3 n=1 Tax=Gloeophyllum trabeum (strain ATCC 11539 / FP-39264 / Madison 617) TaxID=670483 RepID=S7Q8Y1_GLOTA|nr:WD40 repeat-like protein [Gloeophyllum trabeum ATCC 11539]EPQ56441.1 WD40 repeat-like protein [Gloeophyllum trabeum ATCC 11539]